MYSEIESYLQDYKAQLAKMASNPLVAARISELDIKAIIGEYNSEIISDTNSLPIQQWNTTVARTALKKGFTDMANPTN